MSLEVPPVLSGPFPLILGGAFLTALVGALVGTYLVRGWATRRRYLDLPDSRRIHTEPTPNVGGIAIALVATVAFFLWSALLLPEDFRRPEIVAMLLGGLFMFAVGFRDDVQHLRPWTKFALQFAIATAVFGGGVRIEGANFLIWGGTLSLFASYVITTIWIVGTTNAFNLIDGSDGVAAGAALFASASMGVVFALLGDPLGALMAVVLIGACLGFLFFNFPPASIFMGDSGSLFLGYTLAALGVITTSKASTVVAVAIPVVAFGVPLLDTAIAITRRFLRREPIFKADRGHIHHRLRDLGHSPRAVALTIYLASAGFAATSMVLASQDHSLVLPVLVIAAATLVIGVQRLNVPELAELSRVIGRGFQQRWVIAHNLRIQAAVEAMQCATEPAGILEALELAFEGSEFGRLQLWVPGEAGAPLAALGDPRVEPDADGHRLDLTFGEAVLVAQLEIRVPITVCGRPVGRLSLFRTAAGDRLFTDLRLLPGVLVPALVSALDRCRVSAREVPVREATAVLRANSHG